MCDNVNDITRSTKKALKVRHRDWKQHQRWKWVSEPNRSRPWGEVKREFAMFFFLMLRGKISFVYEVHVNNGSYLQHTSQKWSVCLTFRMKQKHFSFLLFLNCSIFFFRRLRTPPPKKNKTKQTEPPTQNNLFLDFANGSPLIFDGGIFILKALASVYIYPTLRSHKVV